MLGENYDWKYGQWYNHHSGIYIEQIDAAVWHSTDNLSCPSGG
jgi:hypothetical protein